MLTAVAIVIMIGSIAREGDEGPGGEVVVPTARPAEVSQDGRTLGDPSAPAAIVEYLDFQCPFCWRAATQVMPAIEQEFIATGQAKLEIRPIAILGSESVQAAAAAECASELGQFWAYHDILFANQAGEQRGAFNDSRLKEFAVALDLDADAFNSCLDSGKYVSQVEQATGDARAAGVSSTPTVLVNGVPVEPTVDAISAAITEAAQS